MKSQLVVIMSILMSLANRQNRQGLNPVCRRLNETRQKKIAIIRGGVVNITVGSNKIMTLEITPQITCV